MNFPGLVQLVRIPDDCKSIDHSVLEIKGSRSRSAFHILAEECKAASSAICFSECQLFFIKAIVAMAQFGYSARSQENLMGTHFPSQLVLWCASSLHSHQNCHKSSVFCDQIGGVGFLHPPLYQSETPCQSEFSRPAGGQV
jgi:hypothetical protein